MFAVIKTGGKQYKVAVDDVIKVERLPGESGDKVEIADVLMLGGEGAEPQVGAPLVDGATVGAQILEQSRGEKIIIFKKQRRQNYRRKNGHRQLQTVLKVVDITGKGVKETSKGAAAKKPAPKAEPKTEAEPKADVKAAEEKPATKKPAAKKPAAKKAAAKKPAAKKPAAKKAAAKKPTAKKPAAKKAAAKKPKSKES